VAFYWDNPVKHDRPLLTNCFVPGLALAAGLKPASAREERDWDVMMTNLALAGQEGRRLSYSRNKQHDYRDTTPRRVISAADNLKRFGLAEGRNSLPGRLGWQSDLVCPQILTDIFDRLGKEPVYGSSEPIILRSRKDGSLLPLKPMRDRQRQVERVNEMLSGTVLGLEMTGAIRLRNNLWLFERLEEDQFGNPRLVQQKLRLDRMEGRRVFTRDLQHHGRLYCPAQNIPSAERLRCTLNGEQVVELDFVSMHVALAYAICDARMSGDSYEIPGFTRKQAKLGLLTAFNAISLGAAIAALTDARAGKPVFTSRKEAGRLIEAMKKRHAPIVSMLCSDAGMKLMNLDSRIIMNAVDWLIGRGIPCVPIHDSIMIQAQYEGEAREALNFGWCTQKLSLTPCNIDKKSRNALQHGGECFSGAFVPPCGGWWSSVLDVARCDVAEWCS
jgi:hypothetical protein